MKQPSFLRLRTLLAITALTSGVAVAAHFLFNVSYPWDDEPAVNEAHVQNRAAQLNKAKRVGDTVSATFMGPRRPYGHFVRQFLISTNAFRQTGGPFYMGGGGGGTCGVQNPVSTIITLDGVQSDLGSGLANTLTIQATADDGTRFVLDQFAIVGLRDNRLETGMQSYGFGGVSAIEPVLGSLTRAAASQPYISSARGFLAPATDVLLIQHQGQHPPNHRFAPTPVVTFQPQKHRAEPSVSSRGWAVVSFGTRGDVQTVWLLPADDGTTSRSLAAKLRAGVRSDFQDQRRHPFTGYFAYQVKDDHVTMLGNPFVSLPMCCCNPPPGFNCPALP